MIVTEQNIKAAFLPKTGLLRAVRTHAAGASLLAATRGCYARHDSDAVSRPLRGRLLAVSLLAGCFMAIPTATALAAGPEAPETPETLSPSRLAGTEATLAGIVNPTAAGEEGATYQFLYRASSTECVGGSRTPEFSAAAPTALDERVEAVAEHLTEHTTYSVCLRIENVKGESTTGNRVTFITGPVEAPEITPATEVAATSATFHGILNPKHEGNVTTYQFIYSESGTECEPPGTAAVGTPERSAPGALQQPVETTASNLLPATTYAVCLRAVKFSPVEVAESPPIVFTTPSAVPAVEEEKAISAGSTVATVAAQIAPGGLSTRYHVEYVTESEFQVDAWADATQVPTPEGALPASRRPIAVSEDLHNLAPSTRYRYRFVASNTRAPVGVAGSVASFTTTSVVGGLMALPDSRAYELVSTSGNQGEVYIPTAPVLSNPDIVTEQPFQAEALGNSVVYMGEPANKGGSGATGPGEGDQWLARRTPLGWVTNVITPLSEVGTAYVAFTPDLSTGFLESEQQPPLAPGAPDNCQILYTRDTSGGTYSPVLRETQSPGHCGHPAFAGAAADGAAILFQSEAALTEGALPAVELPEGHAGHTPTGEGGTTGEPCEFGCNLYEFAGGKLTAVNILPEGQNVANATFGGYAVGAQNRPDFSGAISEDGTRVFWTDTRTGLRLDHIYVRIDDSETVQVSGSEPAEYWTATPDGHYALYTERGGLWRFDTETDQRELLAPESADASGVIGTNVDGEDDAYTYFVANGVLATNVNSAGAAAEAGQPNLYLRHGGATAFIATLAQSDDELRGTSNIGAQYGDWVPNLGHRTAEVTPDGRNIVFESTKSLTGYDNVNVTTSEHAVEVFEYNAEEDRLVCASCAPTGAPPSGIVNVEEDASLLPVSSVSDTTMRRWISEDGRRVFFDDSEPLVPADQNEAQDVYEWEREGTPGCPTATSLYGGCVYLLSGASSKDGSYFVDADGTGDNVFLIHRGQLGVEGGAPEQNELYDARVDGGFLQGSLACTGTGCQGVPPAPPLFATPASVTFDGLGNFPALAAAKTAVKSLTRAQKLAAAFKQCHKDKRKRVRMNCESQARKKYGTKTNPTRPKAGRKRRAKS